MLWLTGGCCCADACHSNNYLKISTGSTKSDVQKLLQATTSHWTQWFINSFINMESIISQININVQQCDKVLWFDISFAWHYCLVVENTAVSHFVSQVTPVVPPLSVNRDLTQKLRSGLMRGQGLHLLHVLRHHGDPLLGWLLFEQRCGDVLW